MMEPIYSAMRFPRALTVAEENSINRAVTQYSKFLNYLGKSSGFTNQERYNQVIRRYLSIVNGFCQVGKTNRYPEEKWFLLAEAGFYMQESKFGKFDHLRCFCCNLEIGDWEPNDHPFTEHIRLGNSHCRYFWSLVENAKILPTAHCDYHAYKIREILLSNEEKIMGASLPGYTAVSTAGFPPTTDFGFFDNQWWVRANSAQEKFIRDFLKSGGPATGNQGVWTEAYHHHSRNYCGQTQCDK